MGQQEFQLIQPDADAWLAAGGDAFRLDLYGQIGRVAPISDGASRVLATIHPDRPTLGCIGDLVGDPALLRAAEIWLQSLGCQTVQGPMELCDWFSYRAAMGPDDDAPFEWEPTTPVQPWLDADNQPIKKYVSILAEHQEQIAAGRNAAAALASRGWRIEPLPIDEAGHIPEGLFHEALGIAHGLFSAGFADVEDYAQVPLELLRQYYGRYRTALDPRLTLMAFDPDGSPSEREDQVKSWERWWEENKAKLLASSSA